MPRLMNGALVDMFTSQKQKYINELQSFPPSDIELEQQTVKEIIDRYIVENKSPEDNWTPMWAAAYYQRLKIILQNRAFLQNSLELYKRLCKQMSRVISDERGYKEIMNDIIVLKTLWEMAGSLAPGTNESVFVYGFLRSQRQRLQCTCIDEQLSYRLDSVYNNIQRSLIVGNKISLSQVYEAISCIFQIQAVPMPFDIISS